MLQSRLVLVLALVHLVLMILDDFFDHVALLIDDVFPFLFSRFADALCTLSEDINDDFKVLDELDLRERLGVLYMLDFLHMDFFFSALGFHYISEDVE
jgi:hypothetical protein